LSSHQNSIIHVLLGQLTFIKSFLNQIHRLINIIFYQTF